MKETPFFHVSFKTIERDARFFPSYVLILIVTKYFLSYSFCIHVTLIKCKYTFIVSQLVNLAHTKLPPELDKINSTLVNIKVFFLVTIAAHDNLLLPEGVPHESRDNLHTAI